MITTNIYTAGVTVADTLTSSEMQSIQPKNHPPVNSIRPVISSSMSSQAIQNVNRGTWSCGKIHLDLSKDGTVSKLGTGSWHATAFWICTLVTAHRSNFVAWRNVFQRGYFFLYHGSLEFGLGHLAAFIILFNILIWIWCVFIHTLPF